MPMSPIQKAVNIDTPSSARNTWPTSPGSSHPNTASGLGTLGPFLVASAAASLAST